MSNFATNHRKFDKNLSYMKKMGLSVNADFGLIPKKRESHEIQAFPNPDIPWDSFFLSLNLF